MFALLYWLFLGCRICTAENLSSSLIGDDHWSTGRGCREQDTREEIEEMILRCCSKNLLPFVAIDWTVDAADDVDSENDVGDDGRRMKTNHAFVASLWLVFEVESTVALESWVQRWSLFPR